MGVVNDLQPSPTLYAALRMVERLVTPVQHLPGDRPNVLTGGYGRTHGVKLGQVVTVEMAEQWLREDVTVVANAIRYAVQVRLTQHEFDALVHFTYNVGVASFLDSTLLRLLNAGQKQAAAEQFTRWKFSDGRILSGLVDRRKIEFVWFLGSPPPAKSLFYV
jgi:lysozyme